MNFPYASYNSFIMAIASILPTSSTKQELKYYMYGYEEDYSKMQELDNLFLDVLHPKLSVDIWTGV